MSNKLKFMYVAFVDILGYKSIIEDSEFDIIAYNRLQSIFNTYISAYNSSYLKDSAGNDIYSRVKRVAFSDSIYLSCADLIPLLDMLQCLFSAVYTYQTLTYDFNANDWMPYIRAGVEHGWVEHFLDPTIQGKLEGNGNFRNPVGSGISKAYLFTEDSPALPGMRIFLRKALLQEPNTSLSLNLPLTFSNIRDVHIDVVPNKPDILEVYWPLEVIRSSNCDFHKMLMLTRDQFITKKSCKHYNATLDLFAESVKISGDEHATAIWERSQSKLNPL